MSKFTTSPLLSRRRRDKEFRHYLNDKLSIPTIDTPPYSYSKPLFDHIAEARTLANEFDLNPDSYFESYDADVADEATLCREFSLDPRDDFDADTLYHELNISPRVFNDYE